MTATAPVQRRLTADDPRLAPWRAFLEAHARVSRRLDEELRVEHDLSLGEYEALMSIAQAPGRRIRMRQLSDRVVLSKSGVTRLIDRLVADGLVERSACLADARGAEAVLTEDGLARLRAASHEACLARWRQKLDREDVVLVDRPGRGYGDDYSPWVVPEDAPIGALVRVRGAAVTEEGILAA